MTIIIIMTYNYCNKIYFIASYNDYYNHVNKVNNKFKIYTNIALFH